MVLTIDIGNTTTSFGLFEGKRLASHFTMTSHPTRTPDELAAQLQGLSASRGFSPRQATRIVLCSVVPRMTAVVIQALQLLHASPIRVVGQDLRVPLKNRYRYPEQVGQDRLVGAYAAWKTYRKTCIVADFGTAITIDVVTKAGEYLGGVIAPGLELSLEALASRTALLPRIELGKPPELLGRDTANSIRSGVLYGCAALCDGLVTQLKRRYAPTATVVATGGSSTLIAPYAPTIDHLKPHLILEGLLSLKGSK